MAKELTRDEIQREFLEYIWSLIEYWDREGRVSNVREKLSGLAFSILSTIDGCSTELPGFLLVPNPHESDKEYHQEREEDWYPEAPSIEIVDIGGSLHERLHMYDPQKKS